MDATDLLNTVRAVLEEYGIAMELPPDDADSGTTVILSRGMARATYDGVVTPKPDLTQLLPHVPPHDVRQPLILTTHLNPRTASALRRAGIQYVDASGNALITFGDVYVRVDGKRAPSGVTVVVPDTTESSNPFSPRRSQVILALITWPELSNAPLRKLAECAGTSVGIAQSTSVLLKNMGLWSGNTEHGRNRLIDMWVTAYPEGLGRTLAIRSFAGNPNPADLEMAGGQVWVSGEALAPNITGQQTLTLYVDDFSSTFAANNRWRRSDTPNIFLRQKFWKDPREHNDDTRSSRRQVPPLLAYADMVSVRDSRVRMAAREFRESHRELVATGL